jgi:hypothetical protein
MELIFYLLYFAIAFFFLIGVWIYPSLALTAILCDQVFDFWGQLISPIFFEHGMLANIYIIIVVFIGLIRAQRFSFKGNRKLTSVILIGYILLSVLAFFSIYWAPNLNEGLGFWKQHGHRIILAGITAPLVLKSKIDLQITFKSLVVIGALLAVLIDVFIKWDGRYMIAIWGNVGFWGALEVSQLAGYVTLAAVLLNFENSKKFIILRVVAVLASIYLCLSSGTRGQFILMILLSIIFLPMSRRIKNLGSYFPIFMFAGFILYIVYLAYFEFIEDSTRWGEGQVESEITGRIAMISKLLIVWSHKSGSDFFTLLFGLGNSSAWDIVGKYPHNVPLEMLAEEGVVGFSIFLILIIFSFHRSFLLYKLTKNDAVQKGISATLIASFLFSFGLSFKQGGFVNTGWNIFFFPILIEMQYRLVSVRNVTKRSWPKTKIHKQY